MKRAVILIAALTVGVIGAGASAGYLLLRRTDYSLEGKPCKDFDVRPAERLYGGKPAVVVDEKLNARELACTYRIHSPEEGTSLREMGMEPGAGLLVLNARVFDTPQQARSGFEEQTDTGSSTGITHQDMPGIGERAQLMEMPFSSDAPQAMSHHLLYVLDGKLLLAVDLGAFNGLPGVDEKSVNPAVVDVAREALSTLG